MAVVTSPGTGTSARNKLAGVVFATWRGVTYMRSLRSPNNPHSPGQIKARRKFQCAALQWRVLIPELKGYFDQLAKLRVPLTSDVGLMPTGISGTYTGYNLHRFAYIRSIVPKHQAVPMGFVRSPSPDNMSFQIVADDSHLPEWLQARLWYSVRPFGVWTRATAIVSTPVGVPDYTLTVDSPIGVPPGTTGDDIAVVFDGWFPEATPTTTIAGSSMPDGRFNPVRPVSTEFVVPKIIDPCAPPS